MDGGAETEAKQGLVGKRERRRAKVAMEREMDLRREEKGFREGEGFGEWKRFWVFFCKYGRGFGGR